MAVGVVYNNKNTSAIVHALGVLRSRSIVHDRECPKLLLAGPIAPAQVERLEQDAALFNATGLVEHSGYVTEEALGELYDSAFAVLMPSLYEGLGIPALEAMQRRVPLIASDLPSLREISQGTVPLVQNPLSPLNWADAMEAVLRRPDVAQAQAEAAHLVARTHTWERVASAHVALLRGLSAINGHNEAAAPSSLRNARGQRLARTR